METTETSKDLSNNLPSLDLNKSEDLLDDRNFTVPAHLAIKPI